ncbi:sugar phosphate isomerase/epimerase family protein [Oleiharenicola lentus]|uniref:sugar phosphate isomerase/epimerase family protein n=1 Tax=Oleiharenicola lentus TaxID=2508720 RepID=UPI003F666CE4
MLTRRHFLTTSATAFAAGLVAPTALLRATENVSAPRYRIAVCDWMILKRQKLGAFPLAHELGADGLELDMGSLGQRETFDNQLANTEIRAQFHAKASEHNLGISSISMSGFYAQSFAARPNYERIVQDCIDTMLAMQVKTAFLPLGVQCDLAKFPELRPTVIERLKVIGRNSADAGVVIGIETALDATGEVALLDEVGSPAIKSYFNFANALQNNRDLHAELRTLGRDRIVQIHASNEDGVWLENDPKIDLPKVKQTLDELNWRGWLVIERSRDATDSRNVKRNFSANVAHLKKVFQPA